MFQRASLFWLINESQDGCTSLVSSWVSKRQSTALTPDSILRSLCLFAFISVFTPVSEACCSQVNNPLTPIKATDQDQERDQEIPQAELSTPSATDGTAQDGVVGRAQDDEEASINIGDKGSIDLQALVQWAAELDGYELMLDDDAFLKSTNKVVFFSRVKVDRKTVAWLVQEILRANGFALVDAPVPGWKRVAALENVPPLVPTVAAGEVDQREYEYVTAIFALEHINPVTAKDYLSTLLPTKQPNGYRELGESKLLLVTDMVRNVRKVERVLKQIDIPTDAVKIEFYLVKNLEAKELADQLESVLGSQREFTNPTTNGTDAAESPQSVKAEPFRFSNIPASTVKVSFDARTNRLVLVGTSSAIEELKELIAELDVAIGSELRTYRFRYVSAARIDALIKQSLSGAGEDVKRLYQSTVDSQANQLVVTAGKVTHERIEALRLQLDRPGQQTEDQGLMQFYKLKNVRAADLVATLQSLDGQSQIPRGNPSITPQSGIRGFNSFPPGGFFGNGLGNGLGNGFGNGFGNGSQSFAQGFPSNQNFGNSSLFPNANPNSNLQGSGDFAGDPGSVATQGLSLDQDLLGRSAPTGRPAPQRLIPGNAQLTIDEHTNTIIVVAEPEVQRLYAQLIERLDVRRPQVLIEAHVVLIEGSDNLNLGVEISGGDREGDKKLFAFSSFGLSEIDPETGALTINPARGFNGTLVDPETADLIVQALATHGRSRVISSPKVVVDDNATGLLSSVAEQPFSTTVTTNAANTTAFGGFAQAGTTINVTPRISDDNYLNLAFDILVNAFTGNPAPNLPPPRTTDQIVSQVTIPDGYTVIVGGLDRQRISRSESGIPYIERIPLLRLLSSSKENRYSEGMLFIFLKPTILRDDQFRDMIHVSGEAQDAAYLSGDYPTSRPKLIR